MPTADLSVTPLSFIRLSTEDQTRLDIKLTSALALDLLTDRQRKIALTNFSEGLRYLTVIKVHAGPWAEALAMLATRHARNTSPSIQNKPTPSVLTILVEQPANTRSTAERKRCMALGALALMAIMLGGEKLSSDFPHQLKQLFRSEKGEWKDLCGVDFLNEKSLETFTPHKTFASVTDFISSLGRLLDLRRESLVCGP